jgi:hypothetical protein
MRQFRVFRHPTLGLQAVKVGVSWPAFFFTFFWMLAKRLWGWAGLWVGIAITLSIFEQVADASPEGGAQVIVYFVAAAGSFAFALVPLFKGNRWRETNLQSRGYGLVATTEAATPDAAIAHAANTRG